MPDRKSKESRRLISEAVAALTAAKAASDRHDVAEYHRLLQHSQQLSEQARRMDQERRAKKKPPASPATTGSTLDWVPGDTAEHAG